MQLENQSIEYKREYTDETKKTVIAFAILGADYGLPRLCDHYKKRRSIRMKNITLGTTYGQVGKWVLMAALVLLLIFVFSIDMMAFIDDSDLGDGGELASGDTYTMQGNVTLSGGVNIYGTLIISRGGTLTVPYTISINVYDGGTVTVEDGGQLIITGGSSIHTGGNLIASALPGGADVTTDAIIVGDDGTMANSGTVTIEAGRILDIKDGATFRSSGSVAIDGAINENSLSWPAAVLRMGSKQMSAPDYNPAATNNPIPPIGATVNIENGTVTVNGDFVPNNARFIVSSNAMVNVNSSVAVADGYNLASGNIEEWFIFTLTNAGTFNINVGNEGGTNNGSALYLTPNSKIINQGKLIVKDGGSLIAMEGSVIDNDIDLVNDVQAGEMLVEGKFTVLKRLPLTSGVASGEELGTIAFQGGSATLAFADGLADTPESLIGDGAFLLSDAPATVGRVEAQLLSLGHNAGDPSGSEFRTGLFTITQGTGTLNGAYSAHILAEGNTITAKAGTAVIVNNRDVAVEPASAVLLGNIIMSKAARLEVLTDFHVGAGGSLLIDGDPNENESTLSANQGSIHGIENIKSMADDGQLKIYGDISDWATLSSGQQAEITSTLRLVRLDRNFDPNNRYYAYISLWGDTYSDPNLQNKLCTMPVTISPRQDDTFLGWSTAPVDGSTVIDMDGFTDTRLSPGQTIYAKWQSDIRPDIQPEPTPIKIEKIFLSADQLSERLLVFDVGTITFNKTAIDDIARQAKTVTNPTGIISITFRPAQGLTADEMLLAGDGNVYELTIETRDGMAITDFSGGVMSGWNGSTPWNLALTGFARVTTTEHLPYGVTAGQFGMFNLRNQLATYKYTTYNKILKRSTFYTSTFSNYAAMQVEHPFTDVEENVWYFNDVMNVYLRELMLGVTSTTFEPKSHTTRGMVAAILYRLAGSPAEADVLDYNGFQDVGKNTWYELAISWANKHGVAKGHSDELFLPDGNITREQIVTMLWRFVGSPDPTIDSLGYIDANEVSDWAMDAVLWAVEAGVLLGSDQNTLDPQAFATRAEMSAFLARFTQVQFDSIEWSPITKH